MRTEHLGWPRDLDPDDGPGGRLARRLYGREPELAALTSVLDAVGRGGSRLLSLEGAAGTGRSALLAKVRSDARRRGWTVVTGRASILEAANDFGVLRQVLAGSPAPQDGRSVPALLGGSVPNEDFSPFDLFELASAHLFDFDAGAPVLITVDDLQWCDALSLRWLAYLAHRSANLPLAVVVAGSPGEMSEDRLLVDELITSCERRTLHGLHETAVGQWITDALEARPDEAFAAGCRRATGGNGALLAELLTALAARSVPPVDESAALIESMGRTAVAGRVLPWIKRAGPEALAVARAVAVLGDDSELLMVAELAGLDVDTAAKAVDRLIRLDILSDTSPLRYVHSLTRAVVNSGISAGLRTSQRLRAARVVRDHYAEPERAMPHIMAVDRSGEPWVLDALRAAAESALARGMAQSAAGYLRRALREPMPPAARAGLLADIGAIELGAGVDGAQNTLLEALDLATEPSLRVRIGVDLAYGDATAGRSLEPALELVDEACAALPPERRDLVAEAEFGLFMAYAASADSGEFFGRRLPRLRERVAGDDRLTALAGVVEAWSDTRRGRDRAGCVHRVRAALEVVDRRKPRDVQLRWLAASLLVDAEEYHLAGALCETDGRFTHRQSGAGDAAIAACLRGRLAHGRGDLKAARTEYDSALETPQSAGPARMLWLLTDIGDLDGADRLVRDHGPAAEAGPTWASAAFAFARASLCMARNQYKDALQGFLESGRILCALGIDNPAGLAWRSQAARCHALLGDTVAAAPLAEEELRLARLWGGPRALSTALAATGVVTLDVEPALEAVSVLNGLDADLHRAAALVDLGTVQLEAGAAEEAQQHLQDGFALAREINARPVSLRAARYIRRAGGRPDLGRISGVTALTAQERAAAERAVTGATNRQIADEMVLTQRTVEQYLTSAYRKLGINGRAELAAALSS
ncbi:regulatory LuxR family protein [Actinoallomurus bryophytorum]|uniref:Regulatory LuxR family protein n=2 Tax=Actinoallomurus bryophytorum TaxID=1490222 RepID=A0A543CKN0_9ACTN|nr:regulatory LuxR family protein [Actinoallomurus bryophytorum]